MIKNPLKILFLSMFVFAAILSANTNKQLMQSAQIVINAFNGTDSRRGNEHLHLTPHLHEIFLHGQMLPDDIKNQLKAVGFNFTGEFVSRRTSSNERNEGIGLDKFYDFGIFRFHYTLEGNNSVDNADSNNDGIPDYIEQMSETFTYVYNKEINEMEYYQPPGDGWLPSGYDNGGSGDYDIYIRQISANYYGYVMSEYNAQNTGNNENSPGVTEIDALTSYMAMRNNYSGFYSSNNNYGPTTELEAMQVTAAHEFFHAVQYGYDGREKPWLLEATATWIEEIVYDEINDCYQYMPSWFDSPHTSLDKTGGTHWYGSYIFFKYIDEHLGGPETIRLIFEKGVETNSEFVDYSHQAISDGLEPVGSSFQDALNKMVIANRVMSSNPGPNAEMYSYEEAVAYPVDGPVTYRTVIFSEGDTETVTSSNLQKIASQYVKVNTDQPIQVSLTNTSGPQTDLNFHVITQNIDGLYESKSGYSINLDIRDLQSIYLSVVSQGTEGFSWNYSITIIQDNKPPNNFTLIAPLNYDIISLVYPKFKWHSSIDPDSLDEVTYTINFGNTPDSQTSYFIGVDTMYISEIKLENNSTFFWNIIAQDNYGASTENQEGIFQFTINNLPPNNFFLIEPIINDTITNIKPTFLWHSSSDPESDSLGYTFELGTHPDSMSNIFSGIDTTISLLSFLKNNTEYFWRVKATDIANNEIYNEGGIYNFIINNSPPSFFSILSPTDSSTINSTEITFQWETAVDSDSNDVITYILKLGANIEYLKTVYTGTDTTFQMNSLSDNTIYHWRVKAIDIAGNKIYNNKGVYTFMTQTTEQIENVTLSAPYPNPFPLFTPSIQNTRLKIVLNETQYIKVKVMNIFGEEVKSLFSGVLTVGFYDHLDWNGKMENGKKAPSGIYFILVEGDNLHTWQKVTLLR